MTWFDPGWDTLLQFLVFLVLNLRKVDLYLISTVIRAGLHYLKCTKAEKSLFYGSTIKISTVQVKVQMDCPLVGKVAK
jgi:hypothetical protein